MADEAKVGYVRAVLDSPMFGEACEIARERMIPRCDNEGLVHPNVGNGYLQQLAGAKQLLAELGKLTGRQERPPIEERRLYSEDDRSLLAKQQEESQP